MTETESDTEGRDRASRRLEAVIETSSDAVYVVDASGRISHANERYADLRGTEQDAVVGTRIDRWAPPELLERIERELASIGPDDPAVRTLEARLSRADGSAFPARLRVGGLDSRDGSDGRVVAIEDLSGTSERERELERRNDRLSRFAGVVAHDIRNSLNVATGSLELVDREGHDEHVDAAAAALVRVEDLVDDVLWLARRGAVIDDPAPVALRDTVENAWRSATAGDGAATFRTAGGGLNGAIAADRSQFRRLLENAFANAVEHGGDDVTVTVGRSDDGLFVEDDGPGVPLEVREDAFDLGYSTADDGTGLGLAIVERIAEAHGWEVTLADGTTGGARLEITGVEESDGRTVGADGGS